MVDADMNTHIFNSDPIESMVQEAEALRQEINKLPPCGTRQTLKVKYESLMVKIKVARWRRANDIARAAFNMPRT